MAKKEKHPIEVKYLDLKKRFKAKEMSIEEVDLITCELITELAILTEKNVTEINGVSIDLYKDRVWWIVENAGLEEDDYYKVEDDFDYEIDDSKFYK